MLALQEDQRRMARIAVKTPADIASRWDPVAALRSSRAASGTHGWTGCSVSCSYRCSGSTSIGRPPPSPTRPGPDITDAGLDKVCFGAGPVERGAGHYYGSAVRACSSSRQYPGRGQSHPLRVARPAPRLRRGPAGPALRERAPLISRLTGRPNLAICRVRRRSHFVASAS